MGRVFRSCLRVSSRPVSKGSKDRGGGPRYIQCGSKRYFPSVPCRRRLFKVVCIKCRPQRKVVERPRDLRGRSADFMRGPGKRGGEQRIDWLKGGSEDHVLPH